MLINIPNNPEKKSIDQIKLNLNIFKLANKALYLKHKNQNLSLSSILTNYIEKILPRCVVTNLSISNLDNQRYFPTINYDNNNLEVGLFQVASPTYFLIDETTMTAGVLKENGIRNVQAINELVENDVIQFNFSYQDVKKNNYIKKYKFKF
jgi:Mini-chromosome maintenance replisome factor